MAHDAVELIDVIEAHDDHEGLLELGMRRTGLVARRFPEVEMQGKQRRKQIVLEALRAIANFTRHQGRVEQVDESLRRIER